MAAFQPTQRLNAPVQLAAFDAQQLKRCSYPSGALQLTALFARQLNAIIAAGCPQLNAVPFETLRLSEPLRL
jgi:hypothetical protein